MSLVKGEEAMPDNKARTPPVDRAAGRFAAVADRFVWLRAALRRLLHRGARRIRSRPVSHLSRHLVRDVGGEELPRRCDAEDARRRYRP